jgi:hypothetical protein
MRQLTLDVMRMISMSCGRTLVQFPWFRRRMTYVLHSVSRPQIDKRKPEERKRRDEVHVLALLSAERRPRNYAIASLFDSSSVHPTPIRKAS